MSRAIGEVALRLGLDPDTLRWFERHGVVPSPGRDAGGRRAYTDDDIHLLEVLLHLRGTGMPLAEIAQFTDYVSRDPDGVIERLTLLQEHRRRVRAEQRRIAASLRVIDQKIADYTARLTD
jgi:DNA-binding transcriptional MerR regulator